MAHLNNTVTTTATPFGIKADAGINTDALKAVVNDSKSPAKQEKTVSKLWLNIGVELEGTIDETTGKPMIVTLPLGIALDNMEYRQVSGDSDVARRIECGNLLLDMIRQEFEEIPEGQRKVFRKLVVEGYKVPEQKASTSKAAAAELMKGIDLGL